MGNTFVDLIGFYILLLILNKGICQYAPGVPPQQYQPDMQYQQHQQYQQQMPNNPQQYHPQQQQYQQQPPQQMQYQQPHMQQQQPQVQHQQVPVAQPPQQPGGHGHHAHGGHGQPQQVLNAGNLQEERAHIAEHMDVPIDTSKMSEQELQFHYFKMHDSDNNNKLDGCELIKSLIHWHDNADDKEDKKEIEVRSDEKLVELIDPIIKLMDINSDGFISWEEYRLSEKYET